MKILITNIWLEGRGGTEMYVRDLAIALHNRNIQVEVYSPILGGVAEEIRQAGIHVVNSIDALHNVPDIIHIHHYIPAIEVLIKFPNVPAIYILHDRTHSVDTPPKHSQIIKYIAVDYNCLDRLTIDEGIPEKNTGVIYNWVDTSRFRLRNHWSLKPKRALVFSNYAKKDNYYTIIAEACQKAGIALDAVGMGMENEVEKPENILWDYDIVFAKAKAAMEALATGANVILCDYRGLGETVTTLNYNHCRKYNFGMKTLNRSIEVDFLIKEIEKYDSEETQKVSKLIREDASFDLYIDKILFLYRESINKYQNGERVYINNDEKLFTRYINNKNLLFSDVFNDKNHRLNICSSKLVEKNKEIKERNKEIKKFENDINLLHSEIESHQREIKRINKLQPRRTFRWIARQLNKVLGKPK